MATDKAKLAIIAISELEVKGFQAPNGFHRTSIFNAAAVGSSVKNAFDFLRSKAIKRLLGKGYTPSKLEIV
ncbi:MAG: hypothetical protein F6J95_033595 [Leptolyngbya sp. SIO1E4]|nr:hypothetical protein [Leptolyngbya sp. SIO1E4]